MMTNSGTFPIWLIVILVFIVVGIGIGIAICCRKSKQKVRPHLDEEEQLSIAVRESDRQTVTYAVVPPSNITLIEDKVKGIINEVKGDKSCPLYCIIYNPSCRIGDTNIFQTIKDLAQEQQHVLLIDTGTKPNPFDCLKEKFEDKVTVIYLRTMSGEVEKTENNTKSIMAIRRLIKKLIVK